MHEIERMKEREKEKERDGFLQVQYIFSYKVNGKKPRQLLAH